MDKTRRCQSERRQSKKSTPSTPWELPLTFSPAALTGLRNRFAVDGAVNDLILFDSSHFRVDVGNISLLDQLAKGSYGVVYKGALNGGTYAVKIEDFLEKAKKEIGTFMRKKGEEAVMECNLLSIPDEILPILGRLYFRTSFGQNVLDHSIETAHIAGILAQELGVNVNVAKTGALLHDIGKAVDHEIEGTHVEIGRRILSKYGVDEKVILAMQAHHEEYPYETLESIIVQVADKISGGRPGARRDSVENYIKRLNDLEKIALSFIGIDKVYALQAGREVRVFVEPKLINDLEAIQLARDIAIKIETEIKYPGEIKINVIRESRVIEFAR